MTDFVHLVVHSEYSISDSIVFLKNLAPAVKDADMAAVALTDRNNLMAMVKFQAACLEHGVKPIIGCDLRHDGSHGASRMFALAMNQTGYHNLIRLVTEASGDDSAGFFIDDDQLVERNEGLILISGGVASEIGQLLCDGDKLAAQERMAWYRERFGDRYYVALSRTGRVNENAYIEAVVPLSERMRVPLVAINDVICVAGDEFRLHDAKMCIQGGERMGETYSWKGRFSPMQYLRSPTEMAELFRDLPDAIENTVEIAKRCNAEVETGTYFQRAFPTDDDNENAKILRDKATVALEEYLIDPNAGIAASEHATYRERLESELEVIIDMGFAAYFLIVQDIVVWAREQGIRVGPGRGSGAASLVAMLLGITGLDPIEHKLFFERLLNRDRRSMPDLDIDFCAERRDEVMWYAVEKFGRECVGRIATHNTHAAKSIVHGMARAMDYNHSDVSRITRMIPTRPGTKLAEAMAEDPEIERTAISFGCEELFRDALKLEGIVTTLGVHPAGLVIAPGRLEEFVPCHREEGTQLLVSQYDKDDVERAGMVKFDLLSVKNLTRIERTIEAVKARLGNDVALELDEIPLDDAATFKLISSANTQGVFQLESDGMKGVVRMLKPDQLADLVALVALYRPGPMEFDVEKSYAHRKHGDEPITYDHPLLEPILKDNYGLMIYQEDVMSVSRSLAGFSGSEADILREAMGKKRSEKLVQLKDRFLEGCQANGVDVRVAENIYQKMNAFSAYAFARAHATAYALITYQTAYLKTHHPREYLAAAISVDSDNPKRVVSLIEEALRLGLDIEPPDINQPDAACVPTDRGFRVGMSCVKGVGSRDVQAIVQARKDGEFESLFDLCMRVDLKQASKNALTNLIAIGAMDALESADDSLPAVRATLHDKLERAWLAGTDSDEASHGMFGAPEEDEVFVNYRPPTAWSKAELLENELAALGVALSQDSPFRYEREFASICTHSMSEARNADRSEDVVVAGIIKQIDVRELRERGEIANLIIESSTGTLRVTLWPEQYEKLSRFVLHDEFVLVRGRMRYDNFRNDWQLNATALYNVADARNQWRANVALRFTDDATRTALTTENLAKLKALFHGIERRSGRRLEITVEKGDIRCNVDLGAGYKQLPINDNVLAELRDIFGPQVVHVDYPQKAA